MPVKVVYLDCAALFSLSQEAESVLRGQGLNPYALPRHDPRLVRTVEMFPVDANGDLLNIAQLRGNRYVIHEGRDGEEIVLEPDDIKEEIVLEPDDIKWVEVECTCHTCPAHGAGDPGSTPSFGGADPDDEY